MPQETLYTQILDLGNLDVYLETPENDESYFSVRGLPEIIGYGKHFFTLTYKDPANSPLLATNSSIVFEFVDSQGKVIFSELADIPDVSGAATGYIWIKEDPLRSEENIFDGELTMHIVGTVEGVPLEWEGQRNLRSTFTFEIRKNQPNLSPIMFYDTNAVLISSSFTETTEEDAKPGYTRGYINISASHLQTQGGKVKFAELSYKETGSRSDQFTLLNTFDIETETARYEVSDSGSEGINPISTTFKTPIPKEIRRETPVIFKLRYLDENKTPAQFYDENRLNQQIEITSSVIDVNGSPTIIEAEDNLLKGSMFTGNAVGKGFEQSGKNSAFMKTVDYTGFLSASVGSGSGGVMFFSGSVLPGSGDDYKGVGLELFANTESFLKFRSDPSVLDIRTDAFFVGSENTQFISASGGLIEISSSKFHLQPDGDVTMAGTIEAADGKIGGFHISESRINSENEKIIFNSIGQISASSLLLASGSFVVDPDNLSRFGQDGFQSFVMVENTGVTMQTSNFNLNTARFIISSSNVGVMAVGSTPPTAFNSGKGFYVDGDGNFLVGDSAGPRIQFDGFQTTISSSNFFLGSDQQFLSGSNGNIEISSSNFHLTADGDVTMAGTITATAGAIGGFNITSNEISASGLTLKSSGQITGSNFRLEGGVISEDVTILGSAAAESILTPAQINGVTATKENASSSIDSSGFASFKSASIAGFKVNTDEIRSANSNLRLKSSGQITGSDVKFTGGKIAAFNLTDDALSTDSFFISASATGDDLFISASSFNINALGIVTASALSLQGGDVGGLHVAEGTVSVGEILKLKDNGQISGSAVLLGNKSTSNYLEFRGSALTVRGDLAVDSLFLPATINGTTSTILNASSSLTSEGFAKFTSASIAGFQVSTDEIRSSDSSLRLKSTGQMSGSSILLGDKASSNFLQFRNNALTVRGDLAVDSLFLPATIDGTTSTILNASSSLTSDGFAKFVSASIAGFSVDTSKIKSSDGTLQLKSDGQITGSKVLLEGGRITSDVTIEGSLSANSISTPAGGTPLAQITDQGFARFVSASIAGFTVDSSRIKSTDASLQLGSDGTITGSKFLLNGGRITSDVTIEGSLSANSISTPAGGSPLAQITDAGFARFVSASIGGFEVSTTQINSSNDNLILKSSGQITGSEVLFDGGVIGGFNIDGHSFTAAGVEINDDSQNTFISSSKFNVRHSGEITGSQVLFSGGKIAGFTIDGSNLTATNFALEAANKKISLGTGNTIFIADADDGIQLGHATFDDAPFSVTKAGVLKATSGTIGGWNLGSDRIFSDNINITSAGTIETSDFASGVKGWRISALNNGVAEFENAVIRGTLSTAVFEKETVNAVGGQLYVANSTALTGSGMISASFTTMSVVNVSGFTGSYGIGGEILSLKKVTETGFTTEYVLVQSASRDDRTSDTNFAGKLFVKRGYASGSVGDSGSLGGTPFNSQSYQPGQVLVSTGRQGTGFIRINAKPTDTATPYIDIVERTGSGIYDVELKARLGDLSGLSSALVGTATGSFGLFTERAFLTKDVTVGTLNSEHIKIDDTSLRFRNNETTMAELSGTTWTIGGANGTTDDAIVLSPDNGVTIFDSNTNKATITSDGLQVFGGDASNPAAVFAATTFIGLQASEHIKITNSSMELKDGSTVYASIGATTTIGNTSAEHVEITSAGVRVMDGTYANGIFNANGATLGTGSKAHISASTLDVSIIKDSNNKSVMSATGLDITQGGTNVAHFGAVSRVGDVAHEHISMSSAGIHVKDGNSQRALFAATTAIGDVANEHVSMSSTGVAIKDGGTQLANFAATTTIGSTSGEHISISSDAFEIKTDATTTVLSASAAGLAMSGRVTATSGLIGGFDIGTSKIESLTPATVTGGSGVTTSLTVTNNGSSNYIIDGISQPTLTFVRGKTYVFDVTTATANGHPFRFAQTADGTTYTTGVTTSDDEVSIVVTALTPSTLYYKCNSHSGMGNSISVISPTLTLDGTNGQITGSEVLLSGGVISGSAIDFNVNKFFLGDDSQYVSGSNSIIEISSSQFLLDRTGEVRVGTLPAEHIIIDSTSLLFKNATTSMGELRGTTLTLGGAHGSTDDSVVIAAGAGVFIYEDSNNYAKVNADGLTVHEGGADVAVFAATSVVGSSTDKVTISDSGITIRENNVDTITLADGVVTVGSSTDKVTINGTSGITIRENDSDTITMADGVVTIGSSTDKVTINGTSGITIKENNKDNISLVDGTIKIGVDENDSTFVQIDSDSVDIIEDVSGTNTTVASFGLATTIGNTSGEHISISSDAFEVKTDANTTVLSASSAGLFMSGSIAAGAGTIGPYDIDPLSLRRHTEDGTFNLTSSLSSNQFLLAARTESNHTDSVFELKDSVSDAGVVTNYKAVDSVGTGTLDIAMKPADKSFKFKTLVDASSFTSAFTLVSNPAKNITEVVLGSGRNNLISLNNDSHPHIFRNTNKHGKQGFAMAQSGSHGTDPHAEGGDAFYLHMGTVSESRDTSKSPIAADYLQFEGNVRGMTSGSGQMSAAFSRHTTMQTFIHNHYDDHVTAKVYLPWTDQEEESSFNNRTGFLAPFWMRCEAVVFKFQALSDVNANLTVRIEKTAVDDDDLAVIATNEIVGRFASEQSVTAKFGSYLQHHDAPPVVAPGEVAAISVQWDSDAMSATNIWVTSVWTVAFDLDFLPNVDA